MRLHAFFTVVSVLSQRVYDFPNNQIEHIEKQVDLASGVTNKL